MSAVRLPPEELKVGAVVGIGDTPEDLRYALILNKGALSADGSLQGVTVGYTDGESCQLFQVDTPVFWTLPPEAIQTVRKALIDEWVKANFVDKETHESEEQDG